MKKLLIVLLFLLFNFFIIGCNKKKTFIVDYNINYEQTRLHVKKNNYITIPIPKELKIGTIQPLGAIIIRTKPKYKIIEKIENISNLPIDDKFYYFKYKVTDNIDIKCEYYHNNLKSGILVSNEVYKNYFYTVMYIKPSFSLVHFITIFRQQSYLIDFKCDLSIKFSYNNDEKEKYHKLTINGKSINEEHKNISIYEGPSSFLIYHNDLIIKFKDFTPDTVYKIDILKD